MKKYLMMLVAAFLMSASLTAKADGALKGYIDDEMCATSKKPMCTAATRAHCAAQCIKGGSAAVLVADGKVYKIANQKAVKKYAGKNVTVEGKITGESIEVTKITEEKS